MRDAEQVTRLACRDHALGRAAGAFGAGPVGIEPEPQRHADGVRQRAQEGDRAVDSAAHGHGDASGFWLRPEDRPERIRKRVDGERLAADRRRLEQRQSCDVALEPRRVGLDDPVAVHEQADGGPLAVPAGVSEDLLHALTVKERPAPASKPSYVILVSQVGAVPAFGNASVGTPAPFHVALDLHDARFGARGRARGL